MNIDAGRSREGGAEWARTPNNRNCFQSEVNVSAYSRDVHRVTRL